MRLFCNIIQKPNRFRQIYKFGFCIRVMGKKRGLSRNKKGDAITEYIIFIVFSLLFFISFAVFLGKVGKTADVYEQIYAKKIALAIDAAKPGMKIYVNISETYQFGKERSFGVAPGTKTVSVRLGSGNGYSYTYFSGYDIVGGVYPKNPDFFMIEVNEKKKTI